MSATKSEDRQITATAEAKRGLQPTAVSSVRETLTLTPAVHPIIQEFLAAGELLDELTAALGSPLNILFPQIAGSNVDGFHDKLDKLSLRGRVYFAHKANRSDSITRQLSFEHCYIDVSSTNELRHALGSGFNARRIQATGPKNTAFLTLALQHGIVISIDSNWELRELLSLKKSLQTEQKVPLLLRVSGFRSAHSQYRSKASRFGIPLAEIAQTFALLEPAEDDIHLLGFSFHLDTTSIPEKGQAIENCLELFERAISLGFDPTVLNIGGGFKTNYLASEQDWHRYTTAIRDAALGARPPLTWQSNTFGLLPDKGALRGSFNSYSYYDPLTGPGFLEELLAHQLPDQGDTTAGAMLRDNGIELWIEPGRSLLDQCGITVGRVNSVRNSSQGDLLVCLNMKRQDICFLDQEIFVDPIVIYKDQPDTENPPSAVYFAGNLCLESDLIYRHQTFLPAVPQPGDLVVFANTAGYFMDFSASQAIMQPTAAKIAVYKQNNRFAWSLDDQYQPRRFSRQENS
jgi:diaminopimelate decarboxylase